MKLNIHNRFMVLIFRHRKKGRTSIEKVFQPISQLRESYVLPCDFNGIFSGLRIILFLLKTKSKSIHITGDVHYVATLLFWKRIILTIHDLNNYEGMHGIKKWIYGMIWFKLPMRFANIITVISPYTKNQLMDHFLIDEKKVIVISNSFQSIKKIPIEKEQGVYNILAIGTKKNKNIENLIFAISGLINIKLTIIGRLSPLQKSLLAMHKIIYKSLFNITEQELALQYNKTDLLFFASTKEGFGLPILEAQSIGVPVITSNTTAMPYVAGEGALLVNPYSVDEIRTCILKIKDDHTLRNDIIQKGLENINRFKPEVFIGSFSELYKQFE